MNKCLYFQLFGCLLIIMASAIVNAETGRAPDPQAILLGKTLYEKHCQVCHQKDGVGGVHIPWGIRHPDYNPAMPLNETSHAWHHGDEQLVTTILEGLGKTRRMPAWKNILSEDDARHVVAYIKSLWSPRIIACQGPRHMSCMH